jgi:hypothetical protein
VIVECTKCVRDVESVVPGVEGAVEPFIYMECTVEPVLPRVNYEAIMVPLAFQVGDLWSHDCLQGPEQLDGRDEPPVDKVHHRWSPCLEEPLGTWRIAHVKQGGLDEDGTPFPHPSPMVDHLRSSALVFKEEDAHDSLNHLLEYNSNDDARLRYEVTRLDLSGFMNSVRMQPSPVSAPDVEGVKEEGKGPVGDYGRCEGEFLVR